MDGEQAFSVRCGMAPTGTRPDPIGPSRHGPQRVPGRRYAKRRASRARSCFVGGGYRDGRAAIEWLELRRRSGWTRERQECATCTPAAAAAA